MAEPTLFMTLYKFGSIVLVLFSQSDGKTKKRPALVILDTGDNDLILAPITTQERKNKDDYKIKNWQQGGLLLDSWVRLSKIACIGKENIERSLGEVSSHDKTQIVKAWRQTYKF